MTKEAVETMTKEKTDTLNVTLPILKANLGPDVLDISKLYKEHGVFTHDPGFTTTSSCESKITFIDGEKGVLLHRGYAIDELATKSDFLEVCFLLLNGELPQIDEKEQFEKEIKSNTKVNEQIAQFLRGFTPDAHPMAMLVGVVGALSAQYHDELDIYDAEHRMTACHRLVAKLPTIAAMAYKHSLGQEYVQPRDDYNFSENFLHMLFSVPSEEYKVSKTLSNAMDRLLILHADHEQNASTSTVRLAGSSGANPYACISAGIASLWGPAHGGANEAVLTMLAEIGHRDRIPEFIEKAKDKNDPFRLMGFGHRVYKNYDPRATVMRETCHEVLNELGIKNEPLLDLAMDLEKIALEDEYFVARKLYPNVDFYSGIILKAMGFPTSMFTVLFAVARTVGWISQWKEMIEDPKQKIGRPRQLYTGHKERKFIKVEDR